MRCSISSRTIERANRLSDAAKIVCCCSKNSMSRVSVRAARGEFAARTYPKNGNTKDAAGTGDGTGTAQVLLNQIVVDPRDALGGWSGEKEFIRSIEERGVQEEIVVVPLPAPAKARRGKNLSRTRERDHKPRYLLIHGRHRYAAACKTAQQTIRIKVVDLDPQDRRAHLEYALVSNEAQSEVDPVTRGLRYQQLIDEGVTVEEIATLIQKGVGYVYQHLDMLKLIPPLRRAVQWEHVNFTQARELLRLEPEAQTEAWTELSTLAADRGKQVKDLSMNEVRVVCRAFRAMAAVSKANGSASRGALQDNETSAPSNGSSNTEHHLSSLYQNFLRAGEWGAHSLERGSTANTIDAPRNGLPHDTDARRQARDPIESLEEIAGRLITLADQCDESSGECEMRQLARKLYTLIAEIEPLLRQAKARAAMACVDEDERIQERVAMLGRSAA